MKINIQLNNVKIQRDIPVSWGEVTFDQFLNLSQANNDLSKIVSVFTGIDPETIRKAKINGLDQVKNALSFIERNDLNTTVPDSILGHKMPKNLELETIGQWEDMKLEAQNIKDQSKESLITFCKFCAIYATNPYDAAKANELSATFLNAPCEEVLAIGNFTLLKLIESSANGQIKVPKANSPMRKLKLAMIAWLRRSVFTVRFYLWKRKLRIKGMSY